MKTIQLYDYVWPKYQVNQILTKYKLSKRAKTIFQCWASRLLPYLLQTNSRKLLSSMQQGKSSDKKLIGCKKIITEFRVLVMIWQYDKIIVISYPSTSFCVMAQMIMWRNRFRRLKNRFLSPWGKSGWTRSINSSWKLLGL